MGIVNMEELREVTHKTFIDAHGESFSAKAAEDIMIFHPYDEGQTYVVKITPVFDDFISEHAHTDMVRRELEGHLPKFFLENDFVGPVLLCEAQFLIFDRHKAVMRIGIGL